MVSQALHQVKEDTAVYSTANGVPHTGHPYGIQTAGPGGPVLLQDFHHIDSVSHFDRERIPERVVHAKGGGAHGYFELTDSLSDITYARPYQTPGYKCPVSARFSTVGGERGTPDAIRDPRGFSVKFKTDIGDMDWVFNNTPVFFIRDPVKFPHFIHTQKRDPSTNLNQVMDSTHTWDYYTQNPECLHQITYMFGDRGIPKSWARMQGYSGHTFKFINDKEELTYVQIHVRAEEGTDNFPASVGALADVGPEYNTKEFYDRLASGKPAVWNCYVQTMTPQQAEEFRYSINDLTKIWPHKEFPLRKFGRLVLDTNPLNYFDEIEQIAFSPAHLVPGIEPSNDPVLQSRLFSYSDTHRHRLGPNYLQIPVNRPRTFEKGSGCPFLAGNFQREGFTNVVSQGARPNYLSTAMPINSINNDPKSFKEGVPSVDAAKFVGVVPKTSTDKYEILQKERLIKQHEEKIWLKSYDYVSGFSEIDVEQPRELYYKVYDDRQRADLVTSIVGHAASIDIESVKLRVPTLWGLIDKDLGQKVAEGLKVKYTYVTPDEYPNFVGTAPAN